MRHVINILSIIILLLGLSLLITFSGRYIIPGANIRDLAVFYLYTTFNPLLEKLTVNSPEAVTAIVWDYRGLDTLFETAVFYLALIAGLALARGSIFRAIISHGGHGLSLIVKTVTKITSPMIITVGAAIALHGHLTPGGGFQGGATTAVVPMILIVVFSIIFLLERGVSKENMLVLRSIGLIGIGITAIALYLFGIVVGSRAFVFQNMAKPLSNIAFPAHIRGILISGTLWFFNLFEFVAVAAGFTLAFMILIMAEKRGETNE
ncbi:MAG: Na(+)/H(+) antiporter subunit B [Desulfurococcaceae archaeon]